MNDPDLMKKIKQWARDAMQDPSNSRSEETNREDLKTIVDITSDRIIRVFEEIKNQHDDDEEFDWVKAIMPAVTLEISSLILKIDAQYEAIKMIFSTMKELAQRLEILEGERDDARR